MNDLCVFAMNQYVHCYIFLVEVRCLLFMVSQKSVLVIFNVFKSLPTALNSKSSGYHKKGPSCASQTFV